MQMPRKNQLHSKQPNKAQSKSTKQDKNKLSQSSEPKYLINKKNYEKYGEKNNEKKSFSKKLSQSNTDRRVRQFLFLKQFTQKQFENQQLQAQMLKKKGILEKRSEASKPHIEEIQQCLATIRENKNTKIAKEILVNKMQTKTELIRLAKEQELRLQKNYIMSTRQKNEIQNEIKKIYSLQKQQAMNSEQNNIKQHYEYGINTMYEKYGKLYQTKEDTFINSLSNINIFQKQERIFSWMKEEKNKRRNQQEKQFFQKELTNLNQQNESQQSQLKKELTQINSNRQINLQQLGNLKEKLQHQSNNQKINKLEQEINKTTQQSQKLNMRWNQNQKKWKQQENEKDRRYKRLINILQLSSQQQIQLDDNQKDQIIKSPLEREWQQIQEDNKKNIQENQKLTKIKISKLQNNYQKQINRLKQCYEIGKSLKSGYTILKTKFFQQSSWKYLTQFFKMNKLLDEARFQSESLQEQENLFKQEVHFYEQIQKSFDLTRQNLSVSPNSQSRRANSNEASI